MIVETKDTSLIVMTYELLIAALVVAGFLTIFTFLQNKANFPMGLLCTGIIGLITLLWRTVYKPVL